jgi:Mn-dependent DtxR family transcriptional regulator
MTRTDPAQVQAFTPLQGQYLAYIYAYSVIHDKPPAERELQAFFSVTPPVVHQMILNLASKGFLQRIPGTARSIQLLVPPETLPILQPRGKA